MSRPGSYTDTLRSIAAGEGCPVAHDAPFDEAKGAFYGAARSLVHDVRETYASRQAEHGSLGLIHRDGADVTETELLARPNRAWMMLESSLTVTMRQVFEETVPSHIHEWPVHDALQTIGGLALQNRTGNTGIDRLRDMTAVAGMLAPATVVNMVRAMPRIAQTLGAQSSAADLARNSAHSLLHEPLNHPQQWAKAFIFCLTEAQSSDFTFDRGQFLTPELIAQHLRLVRDVHGEHIEWNGPTEEFILRTAVTVADRRLGHEDDTSGSHNTSYPAGTRLGDIAVNEPVIGCPGNALAYDMWLHVVEIAERTNLWTLAG